MADRHSALDLRLSLPLVFHLCGEGAEMEDTGKISVSACPNYPKHPLVCRLLLDSVNVIPADGTKRLSRIFVVLAVAHQSFPFYGTVPTSAGKGNGTEYAEWKLVVCSTNGPGNWSSFCWSCGCGCTRGRDARAQDLNGNRRCITARGDIPDRLVAQGSDPTLSYPVSWFPHFLTAATAAAVQCHPHLRTYLPRNPSSHYSILPASFQLLNTT